MMSINWISTALPVGGTPMNSPLVRCCDLHACNRLGVCPSASAARAIRRCVSIARHDEASAGQRSPPHRIRRQNDATELGRRTKCRTAYSCVRNYLGSSADAER